MSAMRLSQYGGFYHMLLMTAERYKIDNILVDMSPGIGVFHKTVLMSCTHFLIPCFPDYFSMEALVSLKSVIPEQPAAPVGPLALYEKMLVNWCGWRARKRADAVQTGCTLLLPDSDPVFLGCFISRFQSHTDESGNRKMANNHMFWADRIRIASVEFARSLPFTMRLQYPDDLIRNNFILSFVEENHQLIAIASRESKPVYKLLRQDLETQVLVGNRAALVAIKEKSKLVKKIARIGSDFDMLAGFVLRLTLEIDSATEYSELPEYYYLEDDE